MVKSGCVEAPGEPRSGDEVHDQTRLEIRSMLLQLAAALDRLDEAGGHADDEGSRRIAESIRRLGQPDGGRAADIQHIYSRQYRADWRTEYGLH